MKIYKCDICGSVFEKINALKLLKKPEEQVFVKKTTYRLFIEPTESFLDICPDCISAVQKVIDERSKGNA